MTNTTRGAYERYGGGEHAHKSMYPEEPAVLMQYQREAAEKEAASFCDRGWPRKHAASMTLAPTESRFASIASEDEDSSDDDSDFASLANKRFGVRLTSWGSDDEDE